MQPLYDGRVTAKLGDTVLGTWALPSWEQASVGRLPGSGLHLPHSWVPSRLCRFLPWEQGWLVQIGRARMRVRSKHLGDLTFRARAVVALQPGQSVLSFPELDDHCLLGVVIGTGEAEGLEVLADGDQARVASPTAYAADRVEMPDSHRQVLAVVFHHLMTGEARPDNVALAAAERLGKSEQAVKNVITKTRDKVNAERWLNLQTTSQLGHYLVHLSRNLSPADLPPGMER